MNFSKHHLAGIHSISYSPNTCYLFYRRTLKGILNDITYNGKLRQKLLLIDNDSSATEGLPFAALTNNDSSFWTISQSARLNLRSTFPLTISPYIASSLKPHTRTQAAERSIKSLQQDAEGRRKSAFPWSPPRHGLNKSFFLK